MLIPLKMTKPKPLEVTLNRGWVILLGAIIGNGPQDTPAFVIVMIGCH